MIPTGRECCDPSTPAPPISRRHPAGDAGFLAICALLFASSAAATVYFCRSMSGGMAMPGGWTMSMTWMRMPGQSWAGAGAWFLSMWTVMMVAMMLPSLAPMLRGYRSGALNESEKRTSLCAVCGAAYFLVWAAFGAGVYALGVLVSGGEMHWPSVARSTPFVAGMLLLLAGGIQLTPWKARHLARCRLAATCLEAGPVQRTNAWRHGVRLGLGCVLCCLGFMMALLVLGVMNLGAMAILAAAITVERIAPRPLIFARLAGAAILAMGIVELARAALAI